MPAIEWLMGRRNKDTVRLVLYGLAYSLPGYLMVAFTGGSVVMIFAVAIIAAFVATLMNT